MSASSNNDFSGMSVEQKARSLLNILVEKKEISDDYMMLLPNGDLTGPNAPPLSPEMQAWAKEWISNAFGKEEENPEETPSGAAASAATEAAAPEAAAAAPAEEDDYTPWLTQASTTEVVAELERQVGFMINTNRAWFLRAGIRELARRCQ